MHSKCQAIQEQPLRWRNGPIVIGISLLASIYSGMALIQLLSAPPVLASCASAATRFSAHTTTPTRACPPQPDPDHQQLYTSWLVPAAPGL
jgi:hypothetical protein